MEALWQAVHCPGNDDVYRFRTTGLACPEHVAASPSGCWCAPPAAHLSCRVVVWVRPRMPPLPVCRVVVWVRPCMPPLPVCRAWLLERSLLPPHSLSLARCSLRACLRWLRGELVKNWLAGKDESYNSVTEGCQRSSTFQSPYSPILELFWDVSNMEMVYVFFNESLSQLQNEGIVLDRTSFVSALEWLIFITNGQQTWGNWLSKMSEKW